MAPIVVISFFKEDIAFAHHFVATRPPPTFPPPTFSPYRSASGIGYTSEITI